MGRNTRSQVSPIRPRQPKNSPPGRFVQLSQLRKLRACEQVAAVCYRLREGAIEFLLVRTRRGRRWTFPKGSAEAGLTHAQAAALEAFEEAGVHGRIEEASFARYVRREQRRNASTRAVAKGLAVNAHLCEVLRLSNPKEADRNRTWLSIDEAKWRLRQGRETDEGLEFVRVVDRAVARIRQLRGAPAIRSPQPTPQRYGTQRDPLQRVIFEAFDSALSAIETVGLPPPKTIRPRFDGLRRPSPPVANSQPREVLECEVLPFASPRWKKVKALGTGVKSG